MLFVRTLLLWIIVIINTSHLRASGKFRVIMKFIQDDLVVIMRVQIILNWLIDLFLLLEYFLTEKNGTCLESNGTPVDDLDTCREAANNVTTNVPTIEKEDLADWPKGCYLVSSGTVYFNSHSSGSSNELVNEICKSKGTEKYNVFISSHLYKEMLI